MSQNASSPLPPSPLRRAAEKGSSSRPALRAFVYFTVAAVSAAAAVFLVFRYVEARTAAARVPTAKVVVAAREVPETKTLTSEDLAVVDWPQASLPAGTFADPALVASKVVITRLVPGEPILAAKLASSEAGRGLAALLPEGMRAVAVRVDDVVGVAGFIHPGDNVDVIVTMRPREDTTSPFISKIVLQNVRVLAVGQEIARKETAVEKAVPVTVATLMVDSEQSEKLALATVRGKLLLTLRSAADGEPVSTTGITPPVLLASSDWAGVALPAKPAAEVKRKPSKPVAQQAEQPAERNIVEVIRGDMYESRDFAKRDTRGGAR